MHPVKTRPYWWIRVWQPFYIKKAGLSHLFQCTERPSTVPPVPDGKIFGSGRFLLLEQCRRRHRNRRLLPDRTRQYGHRSHPDRQRGQYFTNVVLIGLDHNYQDITQGIIEQGITTSPIHIGEHTIIGANVIVLPGITIGKHCLSVPGVWLPKHTRLLCHGRKSRTHYQTL